MLLVEREKDMAFIKTNSAITTHILSEKDAQDMAREPFPAHPNVGDVHEGFIWDGGSWIPLEVWTSRQTSGEGDA